MNNPVLAAISVGAVALALAAAGCGSKSDTAPSSSSPAKSSSASSSSATATAAAADKDYSALLLDATDIAAPGDALTAQAPTVNPNGKAGVATVFSNGDDTREIGDTILVLPSADAAATALKGATESLSSAVVGGTPASAQVGSDSVLVSGNSPDGAKAVTVLLFTEGKAFTTLQFDSAAGDPVPSDFAVEVATKQAAKIKAGLGG